MTVADLITELLSFDTDTSLTVRIETNDKADKSQGEAIYDVMKNQYGEIIIRPCQPLYTEKEAHENFVEE